jgi:hypothetical protein
VCKIEMIIQSMLILGNAVVSTSEGLKTVVSTLHWRSGSCGI